MQRSRYEFHPRPRLARRFESWRDWWFGFVNQADPATGELRYWRLCGGWPPYAPFDSPMAVADTLEQLFVRSGDLIERFGCGPTAAGLWNVAQPLTARYSQALWDAQTADDAAAGAIDGMFELFSGLFARHCEEATCAGPPATDAPLNTVCYMWFDLIGLDHVELRRIPFERLRRVVQVLQRVLAIPHIACQESALHGLGHVAQYDGGLARPAIERFLKRGTYVAPELRAYAEAAREGNVP